MMHNHTGYICLTFLHCVFLNVASHCLLEKMHSHIGCICLIFLHCVFFNVSSEECRLMSCYQTLSRQPASVKNNIQAKQQVYLLPVLGLGKGDKAIQKLVINNVAIFTPPKMAKIAISCFRTFETVRQHCNTVLVTLRIDSNKH